MPFVLAHVSDLHVSTFGDTLHDRLGRIRRSARIADVSEARWEIVAGGRLARLAPARRARGRIALVDPAGYAHPVPSARASGGNRDPVERAAARACRLEARRASTLASSVPSEGALSILEEATPTNTNLRLLRAARVVEASDVDAVLVTGDLTEDGDGYELVTAAFARYRERGRLFVIPGNHDLYLMPMGGSTRPPATHASKRARWRAFAAELGHELHETGAWVKTIPEAETILVGLDSCARPQRRFYRQRRRRSRAARLLARAVGQRVPTGKRRGID
ncbi:MAG: metallophosphoesterase family protein [Polyangiaceae bacterium]